LDQKTIIITGANRGIGRNITESLARSLAGTNTSIIMACRNIERSIDILSLIIKESKNQNIELLELDLASIKSIRSFGETMRNKKTDISVLINNAGVLKNTYQETEDGYELNIGVNYIGQYLLTKTLLPMIVKGTGRIINASSLMYRWGRVGQDFFRSRKTKYRGFSSYSDSKLAFLLFSLELAEQVRHDGITVNSADPGVVSTNMITMNKWFDPLADIFFRPFIRSGKKGAETSVFLASDKNVNNKTGKYFSDKKERKLPKWVVDHPYRKELLSETEKILGV
jgi:NAD(P)-dependent dehydrogenase (short-subunit alcohol dehydrogenase family)